MAPGKFELNFRYVIFKWISETGGWGISCEIALIWMSLDFTDNQSTLVQVMAWCRQATSHYLIHCWPRSLSPYDVTRPQWVKDKAPLNSGHTCVVWWSLIKLYKHALSKMCQQILYILVRFSCEAACFVAIWETLSQSLLPHSTVLTISLL